MCTDVLFKVALSAYWFHGVGMILYLCFTCWNLASLLPHFTSHSVFNSCLDLLCTCGRVDFAFCHLHFSHTFLWRLNSSHFFPVALIFICTKRSSPAQGLNCGVAYYWLSSFFLRSRSVCPLNAHFGSRLRVKKPNTFAPKTAGKYCTCYM